MAMDTFPPEIYSKIFAYACTDDGSTGASLLSVSHAIRSIVKPHAFHSIALRDASQIETFAKLVKTNPELVKGVRHLFVCDEQQEEEEERGGSFRQRFVDFTNRHLPGMRRRRLRKKTKSPKHPDKRLSTHTAYLISQNHSRVSPALLTMKPSIISRFRTLPLC